MKVGYFAFSETYRAPHAGFVHTYNIISNLAGLGVDIKLFIPSSDGEFVNKENFDIIPVTLPKLATILRKNPSKYIKSYSGIIEKTKDLDIIHERFHINPVDLLFVKDKKYVLEVNDPGVELYSGFKGKIYSYLINKKFGRCDVLITQTKTLKKIIERHTEKPVYVIPNGVDVEKFNPSIESDVRERYGIKRDEVLVTFVGSFREWHGVEDIPKIAEMMKKDNVRFLLVGSGPLFKDMKEKYGDDKKIILAGAQPSGAVPLFLAASDVLIAPFNMSKFKQMERYGFWWSPVKLYEYMACGKAIVSFDFEEVRHIVRDAGLLAKPGDMGDFTEKISILVEDERLRLELGGKSRSIAGKEYSWENRAEQVLDIYRNLVNQG